MKEKIFNILKIIHNKINFFILSLIFLVSALLTFIAIKLIFIASLFEYNYFITNSLAIHTAEEIKNLTSSPLTYEQSIEILNKIDVTLQPYYNFYYFFITITIACLIVGIYKLIQKRK